jgi:hypothetical protein
MNIYISLIEKLPYTLFLIIPLLFFIQDNQRKKDIALIILFVWNILIGIAFYMFVFTKNNLDNTYPFISFVESFPVVLVLIFLCIGLLKNSQLRKTLVIIALGCWLVLMQSALYILIRF